MGRYPSPATLMLLLLGLCVTGSSQVHLHRTQRLSLSAARVRCLRLIACRQYLTLVPEARVLSLCNNLGSRSTRTILKCWKLHDLQATGQANGGAARSHGLCASELRRGRALQQDSTGEAL